MLSYSVLVWSIAIALFVMPCILPRILLLIYVAAAAIALGLVLHDHHSHELDNGGVAATLGLLIVLWWACHAILGLVARLLTTGLRALGVRLRYAWLPAPILLAALTAATTWILCCLR